MPHYPIEESKKQFKEADTTSLIEFDNVIEYSCNYADKAGTFGEVLDG
jgi:hypothetical protein